MTFLLFVYKIVKNPYNIVMKILLWEKRKQKNLTLIELSKLTDLGKSTLNDLENEKYSPTMQQMEQIAKGMNLKITDLFDSEYK